jgi:coenzyme Q-binding protein COQ10
VADVGRYPEFLPWCLAGRVRKRVGNVETAELIIGFGPFHEKFVSEVTLAADVPSPRIDTVGTDGPFRRLRSQWVFHPRPEGTMIEFELEFEFRSALLQHTVRLLFAEAVKKMVSAFEARARALYGQPVGQGRAASSGALPAKT